MAKFSLFTKEVRDWYFIYNSFIFLRAEFAKSGYLSKGIKYKRRSRTDGRTNYNFFGILVFAFAGFLSTTTSPLRITIYLSFVCLLINILWFIFKFNLSSLILLNLLSLNLFIISACLYLARSYKNSLNEKKYIILEKDSNY